MTEVVGAADNKTGSGMRREEQHSVLVGSLITALKGAINAIQALDFRL